MDKTEKDKKGFNGNRVKVYIPLFIASMILSLIIYFVFRQMIFGNNAVLVHPRGLVASKGIIPDFILFIVIGTMLLFLAMTRIVGRPIVLKLCNNSEKEIAGEVFGNNSGAKVVLKNIGVSLIAIIFSLYFLIYANSDCIGFNDSSVSVAFPYGVNIFSDELNNLKPKHRFTAYLSQTQCYEKIKVYSVQVWSSDSGEIHTNDDEYYYIIDFADGFYEVPVMSKDSSEGKIFAELLGENKIEVIEVEHKENIPNIR